MRRAFPPVATSFFLALLVAGPLAGQRKTREDPAITEACEPVMTYLIINKASIGLEAERIARSETKIKGQLKRPGTHLVLVPKESFRPGRPDSDSLAWEIAVASTDEDESVYRTLWIDAHTGKVLEARDQGAVD